MEEKRIRIVIADDQALMRAGFRLILESQPDMRVVGEASQGEEAISLCRCCSPDVILMDIRMPDMDGLEATRQILANHTTPGPRIIILTTFDLDEYVYTALSAGASGFLLKDVSPEQLIAGIRSVHAGDELLSPQITQRLIERFNRPVGKLKGAPEKWALLTPREQEILQWVARGMSNAEIAARLILSEATVKTHVARILSKLEFRDRIQIVVFAYESGFIQPGSRSMDPS